MPLFGSKHKHSPERDNARHHHHNNDNAGTARGTGPNGPAGAGTRTGAGAGGPDIYAGYHNEGNNFNQPGHAGNAMNQSADPYSNTVGANDPSVPPANHINNNQKSGGGGSMSGKIEHAVGTLVGSQQLKARGLQKEQEAQAFKAQSAEISEAERLEKEAMLRRERAVQHGAHPDNRHLGGIMGGNSMQSAPEYGNNFGNTGAGMGGHGMGSGVGPTGPQGGGPPM